MLPTPTIGRIVHFNLKGTLCAAIICKVWSDECVNLVFFTENGENGSRSSCVLGEGDGKWIWPQRVG